MICPSCKAGQHADCPGGTWCDCQHRTDRTPAVLLGVHTPPDAGGDRTGVAYPGTFHSEPEPEE